MNNLIFKKKVILKKLLKVVNCKNVQGVLLHIPKTAFSQLKNQVPLKDFTFLTICDTK